MPKVVNHRTYRRELLAKTSLVFETKNYADVSMREIARAIDVSTGTLYHYFPSKEELFCALFLHSARTSAREIFDYLCSARTFEQKIDALFSAFTGQCQGMRRQFLFSADLMRNQMPAKANLILQRWAHDLNRRLSSLIGLSQEEGMMVFLFLAGSLYTRQILPDSNEIEPAFDKFKKMIIKNHKNKSKGELK